MDPKPYPPPFLPPGAVCQDERCNPRSAACFEVGSNDRGQGVRWARVDPVCDWERGMEKTEEGVFVSFCADVWRIVYVTGKTDPKLL